MRPEKREQVEKCVREGKIQTGPWYILQDEFLTSGEACVRNLQVGMQEAAHYGAIGNVGYFPDAFGKCGTDAAGAEAGGAWMRLCSDAV